MIQIWSNVIIIDTFEVFDSATACWSRFDDFARDE